MQLPKCNKIMFLDVESIGLYGEAFAFGFQIFEIDHRDRGQLVDERLVTLFTGFATGEQDDRDWVEANVPNLLDLPYCQIVRSPLQLRHEFWSHWMIHRDDTVIVADCCYPVETNFLAACIQDDLAARKWLGPYPLLDLASFYSAMNCHPTDARERRPDELPAHNPLNDARQTARLFFELFDGNVCTL